MARPSDPLLKLLRDALQKRGGSTAELASRIGMDRADLKRRLTGAEDLTIDQFLVLAEALELQKDVAGLASLEASSGGATPSGDDGDGAVAGAESLPAIHTLRSAEGEEGLDTFGNPARELVRGGFGWGLDMFLQFDATQLAAAGVPEAVLRKFPETFPIRLDPRWHRHNRPAFGDEAFTVTLSFDALRVCTFPWSALRTISFTIPADAVPPPQPAPPDPASAPRPVLRLVKE